MRRTTPLCFGLLASLITLSQAHAEANIDVPTFIREFQRGVLASGVETERGTVIGYDLQEVYVLSVVSSGDTLMVWLSATAKPNKNKGETDASPLGFFSSQCFRNIYSYTWNLPSLAILDHPAKTPIAGVVADWTCVRPTKAGQPVVVGKDGTPQR